MELRNNRSHVSLYLLTHSKTNKCKFCIVNRPATFLGLHDSIYLDLITLNVDAIGELPAQDDDHDSNIHVPE